MMTTVTPKGPHGGSHGETKSRVRVTPDMLHFDVTTTVTMASLSIPIGSVKLEINKLRVKEPRGGAPGGGSK